MPRAAARYALPPRLEAELSAWCQAAGDDPQAVIADLVEAFLDDLAAEAEALELAGAFEQASAAADAPAPEPLSKGRGRGLAPCDVAARIRERLNAGREAEAPARADHA